MNSPDQKLIAAVAAGICAFPPGANTTENAPAETSRHALKVSAAPVTVNVAPGDNRRNAIVLPALDYVFSLDARCAPSFTPESVSLTVADSRTFVRPEEPDSGAGLPDATLTVPANQLAPLIVEGFCTAAQDSPGEAGIAGDASVTVSATLSASASLLCIADQRREMIYTSTPLDVTLVCAPTDETED